MQAGAIGVGAPRVERALPEITITGTEFRDMQAAAQAYARKGSLVLDRTQPHRMSLNEAFEALAAGEIDLEDPNSPIRHANGKERDFAVKEHPDLRHFTLLSLDDGINEAVMVTIGDPRALGGGRAIQEHEEEHSSRRYVEHDGHDDGGELHVDLERQQPEVIFHDGPPPAEHDQFYGQGPEYPPEQPPMRRGQFDDDERAPMMRGDRGEPIRERREPQMAREPMERGPARGMPVDDTFDRGGPELRVRAEDAPQARKVGGKKPAEKQGGEDKPMKVGRVTLSAADHKQLHEIADNNGISVGKLYDSLRAPTNDERLVARGSLPFIKRDAEAQERLVTIDTNDKYPPLVVSFAQKKSTWWRDVNLLSGALHLASAVPGVGGVFQLGVGALTAVAGVVASFLPFVKREHNLDLIRTGLKHMALGAIAIPTDYMSLGATWYVRAPLALAMGAYEITQFFKSRNPSEEAAVTEIKGKPSLWQRTTGFLDTLANGAMAALGR